MFNNTYKLVALSLLIGGSAAASSIPLEASIPLFSTPGFTAAALLASGAIALTVRRKSYPQTAASPTQSISFQTSWSATSPDNSSDTVKLSSNFIFSTISCTSAQSK
jgi:hypothetical protein